MNRSSSAVWQTLHAVRTAPPHLRGAGPEAPLPPQASDINALFGFRIECIERLGDPHGVWAWTRLNALFNWLPLAACIEDKVLCMHGGVPCLPVARLRAAVADI